MKALALEEKIWDKIVRLDKYKFFMYFIIFGFIGWVFETLVVYLDIGELTVRGNLFIQKLDDSISLNLPVIFQSLFKHSFILGLPVIELYGLGGCIMVILFSNLKERPVVLFFCGLVFMSLLELGASYICTGFLGKSYWDYSSMFMNFQGRICFLSAISWGALSVFAIKFLIPSIEKLYSKIEGNKNIKKLLTIVVVYVIFCGIGKYWIGVMKR